MRWYRANGRHVLPWRETRDPYAILVSEVMLQQTQVERVIPYYRAWMDRWPTLESLAEAPLGDVIRAWSGLGYNRRAVNLHRAAAAAIAHGRRLPVDPLALGRLPGIGPYTSAAVACFSGDARLAVLDTNTSRVIARAVAGVATPRAVPASRIRTAAEMLLPVRRARDHNLALMDLGALVCTARAPVCSGCPLRSGCAWLRSGAPAEQPGSSATATPFAQTARFARGRIVEALRHTDGPCSAARLRSALPPIHQPRLAEYLTGLEADGLVERAGLGWSIAGDQPMSIASPKL